MLEGLTPFARDSLNSMILLAWLIHGNFWETASLGLGCPLTPQPDDLPDERGHLA